MGVVGAGRLQDSDSFSGSDEPSAAVQVAGLWSAMLMRSPGRRRSTVLRRDGTSGWDRRRDRDGLGDRLRVVHDFHPERPGLPGPADLILVAGERRGAGPCPRPHTQVLIGQNARPLYRARHDLARR
jgi:hypothetical protein